MAKANVRTIHTGLYGDQAYEVLERLHGQLSDGKWENSPGYDKYWTNFDVVRQNDGETTFVVSADSGSYDCGKYRENPFRSMSEQEFKAWIAKKIKAVAKDELKDCTEEIGEWNRKNIEGKSIYLGHDEGYGTVVSIADIYYVYEVLLGRTVNVVKYANSTISNVFGTKFSAEKIAQNEAIASTKAMFSSKRDALNIAKEKAIENIKRKYLENRAKLDAEETAEIEKIQQENAENIAKLCAEEKAEIKKITAA